ncbi:MAG: hypothetical protein JSV12_08790 [Candidatus Bathyarchaeota archaeon]|nr:MAG: hypothetical protein JSV12_08790 [Candidatus Bathyarchaeota archaeon]
MKSRKKLVHGSLLLLMLFVCLSAFGVNVQASQVIIHRTAPYDGAQWYEGGEEASASANLNGYHSVHVAGPSYAYAYVGASQYYTGANLNKIAIYITVRSASVSKDPWGCSYVKFRAWIWDATTSQLVWQGEKDYVNADSDPGKLYYWTNIPVNIYYGHTYWFWAGVKAESWTFWFFRGWANAHGTVYKFYACQWPL